MITLSDLKGINRFICEDNRQESIVINESNLLSALSVQQWYENLADRASALVRSLTIAHGFQDGNKRTAATAGMLIKSYTCSEQDLIDCILEIALGNLKNVSEIREILYPDGD